MHGVGQYVVPLELPSFMAFKVQVWILFLCSTNRILAVFPPCISFPSATEDSPATRQV